MDAATILDNMVSRAEEELGENVGFEIGFLLPCGQRERAFIMGDDGESCPFAWMEADSETGEVLKFAYCADEPLVSGWSVEATVDREPPAEMSVEDYIQKNREIREAYEAMRRGGDRETFIRLFRELVSPGLMEYYRGMAKEFTEKFIIKNS